MSVMIWRIISTIYQDQLRAWVIEDGDCIIGDGDVLDEFKAVWIHVVSISPAPPFRGYPCWKRTFASSWISREGVVVAVIWLEVETRLLFDSKTSLVPGLA
jgi:hypothetical protein